MSFINQRFITLIKHEASINIHKSMTLSHKIISLCMSLLRPKYLHLNIDQNINICFKTVKFCFNFFLQFSYIFFSIFYLILCEIKK